VNYEPATRDSGGPRPGAIALRDYAHSLGFSDAGIYNPRNVRGSTTTLSLHAEGRAVDLTIGARDDTALTELLHELIANCLQLGVQMVIWQRASWRIGRGWRPYSGTDPHTGHAHVELTRSAGDGLTVDIIRRVLEDDMTPEQAADLAAVKADVAALAAAVQRLCDAVLNDSNPDDGMAWNVWHLRNDLLRRFNVPNALTDLTVEAIASAVAARVNSGPVELEVSGANVSDVVKAALLEVLREHPLVPAP
jgi:hypothetical protein